MVADPIIPLSNQTEIWKRAESGRMDGIIETGSRVQEMALRPQPFRIRMMTSAKCKNKTAIFI